MYTARFVKLNCKSRKWNDIRFNRPRILKLPLFSFNTNKFNLVAAISILRNKLLSSFDYIFHSEGDVIRTKNILIRNCIETTHLLWDRSSFEASFLQILSFNCSSNNGMPKTQSNTIKSSNFSSLASRILFVFIFLGSLVTVELKLDRKEITEIRSISFSFCGLRASPFSSCFSFGFEIDGFLINVI